MFFKNLYMAAKLGVPAGQIATYMYRSAVCGLLIGLVLLSSMHIMLLWALADGLQRLGDVFQELNYRVRDRLGLGESLVDRIAKWHSDSSRHISKRMREHRVTENYKRDVDLHRSDK